MRTLQRCTAHLKTPLDRCEGVVRKESEPLVCLWGRCVLCEGDTCMWARASCPDTCEVREGEEADAELLSQRNEVLGLLARPGPRITQPQEAQHQQRLQCQQLELGDISSAQTCVDCVVTSTHYHVLSCCCWAVSKRKRGLHLIFFIHDESATSLRFFVRSFVVGIKTE